MVNRNSQAVDELESTQCSVLVFGSPPQVWSLTPEEGKPEMPSVVRETNGGSGQWCVLSS